MRSVIIRSFLFAVWIFAVGCASRPLPKYEKPIARAQFQHVRTTAYTHTESDHVQYSNHNALGGELQSGAIHSAAADWSRWPAGTVFRIAETGEVYKVDDYGWALSGTNTIDLYKPSRAAMNAWGVRRVTIENLEWGDAGRSLAILRPRSKYRHVQRMVREMEERFAELTRPVPIAASVPHVELQSSNSELRFANSPRPIASAPPQRATPVQPFQTASPPVSTAPIAPATPAAIGVARNPFFTNGTRQ